MHVAGPPEPDLQDPGSRAGGRRITQYLLDVESALSKAGVPPREREAIKEDLRAQIQEMLAERGARAAPTWADVEAILARLDPPEAYARSWLAADEPAGPSRPPAAPGPPGPVRGPWSAAPDDAPRRTDHRGFTDLARKVMALASQHAHHLNHESIGTEHVLIGLLKAGGVATNALASLNLDRRALHAELERLAPPGPPMTTPGKLPMMPRTKELITAAYQYARLMRHDYVGTEHLLLGLVEVRDGVGARVLDAVGATREHVRATVFGLIGSAGVEIDAPPPATTDRPASGPFTYWPAGTGRVVVLGGEVVQFVATGDDTGGAYAMFEVTVPPGAHSPPHVQRREDEAVYVLEGELSFQVGDRTITATAGAFVRVPRGTRHAYRNAGEAPARAVVVASPAGIEQFFAAAGQAIDRTSAAAVSPAATDWSAMAEVARRYGIEYDGPTAAPPA